MISLGFGCRSSGLRLAALPFQVSQLMTSKPLPPLHVASHGTDTDTPMPRLDTATGLELPVLKLRIKSLR